jgi:hypothetical protein
VALAICVLITWIVVIILSLIPKKLTQLEMVYLFFVNTIFELSLFTLLHVNLRWITVNLSVEKSFADLTMRLFMIPLALIISTNILLYSWKFLKWVIVLGIIFFFNSIGDLLEWLGVLKFHSWNRMDNSLLFIIYITFSRFMAWVITHVGQEEVKKA